MSQPATTHQHRQDIHLEAIPVKKSSNQPLIPVVASFLDSALLSDVQYRSLSRVPIKPELKAYVLDDPSSANHVKAYLVFDTWLPFIPQHSLQRWSTPWLAPQFTGEEILLLACLKNLTRRLTDDNATTKEYLLIKCAFLEAELARSITISTLQALVLLLIYEFGHGLYPCAYTTLGECVRYLELLGIDGHGPAAAGLKPWYEWLESETKRRLWWAVYVTEV